MTQELFTSATLKVNFSELKRLREKRQVPELHEKDLQEKFVRGSGPGGQSINKTENCVCLHVLYTPLPSFRDYGNLGPIAA